MGNLKDRKSRTCFLIGLIKALIKQWQILCLFRSLKCSYNSGLSGKSWRNPHNFGFPFWGAATIVYWWEKQMWERRGREWLCTQNKGEEIIAIAVQRAEFLVLMSATVTTVYFQWSSKFYPLLVGGIVAAHGNYYVLFFLLKKEWKGATNIAIPLGMTIDAPYPLSNVRFEP